MLICMIVIVTEEMYNTYFKFHDYSTTIYVVDLW